MQIALILMSFHHHFSLLFKVTAIVTAASSLVVQAKAAIVASAPLSDWFVMSEPEMYTVQASEKLSDDPRSEVIKSNRITISVLPFNDATQKQ